MNYSSLAKIYWRNMKLGKLKKLERTPPGDKTSLRAMAEEAYKAHPIIRITDV